MEQKLESLWQDCLEVIKTRVPDQTYETWFKPIKPVNLEEEKLTVQVPSQFFYEWIENHYRDLIHSTLEQVSGNGLKLMYSVVFSDEDSADSDTPTPRPQTQPDKSFRGHAGPKTFLNERYTFDNFVEGDNNQFARAAAVAVAEAPGGTSFNPLVLYGGVGLGKTHLAQAIGNKSLADGTANRVLYTSSEKFTLEFINSIKNNKTTEFSEQYRNVDLLIVDDVQFFQKKESTQEQFFHTFNALYQGGKQVVLTSDRPPKELSGLEERLLSRFHAGLIADIQPPDLETRIAILQHKAQEDNIEISYDILEFLAANITTNVRELEGSLIRLLAFSSLSNTDITIDLAKKVLRELVGKNFKSAVSIEDIQAITGEVMDVSESDLIGKGRKMEVALARQVAMYLSRELTNSSLKTIGLHFGGRDHSTVVHACNVIEEKLKSDETLHSQVKSVKHKIEMSQL
ncbi:MAG: chromosomal replication initiator protein DnaA [Candidatus Marinimicrobia bacterium]|nr:chromosomal replication initiator protein DnaA [Candidatus Neomarinimicrobiota bacterium]MCF7829115.1 chromosomal replication initiator protein DnaA [Candidatus Neomarinimicrobiota bacterium]MCF7881486.1 chromosomal replication initiator protein DnaA [Candidatus Neomarinimicrobiota bacterium]